MSEDDCDNHYIFPRRSGVSAARTSAVSSAKAFVNTIVKDIRNSCTQNASPSEDDHLHKWYISEVMFRQATDSFERARRFKHLGKPLLAKMQEARCRKLLDELVHTVKAKILCARFLSLALCFEEEDYWKARGEASLILESLDTQMHIAMEDPIIELALSQATWRVGLNSEALTPLMDADKTFPNHSQLHLALSEHWLANEEYERSRDSAQIALMRNDAYLCFTDRKKERRALECLAWSLIQRNISPDQEWPVNVHMLAQELTIADLRVRGEALRSRLLRRKEKERTLREKALPECCRSDEQPTSKEGASGNSHTLDLTQSCDIVQERCISRYSADIPPDDGEAIRIPKPSTIQSAQPMHLPRVLKARFDHQYLKANPSPFKLPPVLDENSEIDKQWPPMVDIDSIDKVTRTPSCSDALAGRDILRSSPDIFTPHVVTFSRPSDDQVESSKDLYICDLMPADHPKKVEVLRNPFEDEPADDEILGLWCCNRACPQKKRLGQNIINYQ